MKKTEKLIEFKGGLAPVIMVTLRSLDIARLSSAAKDLFGGEENGFFNGEAALLNLGQLPLLEAAPPAGTPVTPMDIDWQSIFACLTLHGLKPVGLMNVPLALHKSVEAANLPVFPTHERRQKESPEAANLPPPEASPAQPIQPKTPPPASAMMIDRPLRSGQKIYARNTDLIVTAIVNPGAEVIADGSIHIYAPLRGRALAGASGDASARIFTTCFEAELVSIAGIYRTFADGVPPGLAHRPAQIKTEPKGGTLLLETLKLD